MTMLLAATFACLLCQDQPLGRMIYLGEQDKPESMILMVRDERLDPPKFSPKGKLMFEWLVSGFSTGLPDNGGNHALRFRVFSQEKKQKNDRSELVARMLMRLWKYNFYRLKLDHNQVYNNRIIDVYLQWGGKAGGEQLFASDEENGQFRKVNNIYIYDLSSFSDPVEMAREVAHEYGHASLPAVGGFGTPEDWGNGYLGEKLYLRWMRDDLKSGGLQPEDAMGADLKGLDTFVKAKVDPLVLAAATTGPDNQTLIGEGQPTMDAYMGLALYAEQTLPPSVFARSLKLGGEKAISYPAGLVTAAAEVEHLVFNVPESLRQKEFWVPIGKGKLQGATLVSRKGDWALVKTLGQNFTIINPPL